MPSEKMSWLAEESWYETGQPQIIMEGDYLKDRGIWEMLILTAGKYPNHCHQMKHVGL